MREENASRRGGRKVGAAVARVIRGEEKNGEEEKIDGRKEI